MPRAEFSFVARLQTSRLEDTDAVHTQVGTFNQLMALATRAFRRMPNVLATSPTVTSVLADDNASLWNPPTTWYKGVFPIC